MQRGCFSRDLIYQIYFTGISIGVLGWDTQVDLQVPGVLADYITILPKYIIVFLLPQNWKHCGWTSFPRMWVGVLRHGKDCELSHIVQNEPWDVWNLQRIWEQISPFTAALDPDAILRDKHPTVSDQNIIDWIPNIIYRGIRGIHGTAWSSRHQLYQASDHLVRSWWSHGEGAVEFALFFLLFHPYWRKWRYSPHKWRLERKEVLKRKFLVVSSLFTDFYLLCSPSRLSAIDLTKPVDVVVPHQLSH